MKFIIKLAFLAVIVVGIGATAINKGWLEDVADFGKKHEKEAKAIQKGVSKVAKSAAGALKDAVDDLAD